MTCECSYCIHVVSKIDIAGPRPVVVMVSIFTLFQLFDDGTSEGFCHICNAPKQIRY